MIRMILSIAMAFLSLLLRNIVSIVFILIAMMMVLFTIVKSKVLYLLFINKATITNTYTSVMTIERRGMDCE